MQLGILIIRLSGAAGAGLLGEVLLSVGICEELHEFAGSLLVLRVNAHGPAVVVDDAAHGALIGLQSQIAPFPSSSAAFFLQPGGRLGGDQRHRGLSAGCGLPVFIPVEVLISRGQIRSQIS